MEFINENKMMLLPPVIPLLNLSSQHYGSIISPLYETKKQTMKKKNASRHIFACMKCFFLIGGGEVTGTAQHAQTIPPVGYAGHVRRDPSSQCLSINLFTLKVRL